MSTKEPLSGHAAYVLEAVRGLIAPEEIEQVDLLIRVMAGFDSEGADNLEAVGTLATLLADHCALESDVVATCFLSGRVHDIGKLAISRGILQKSGAPTKAEWVELKLHPVYGGSTLAGLPRLKRLAPIVIAHHERVDGRGYPNGLAGSEIPVESRIIAIVDSFCAMTTPRPYSAARLPHEAILELQRCAGTQFDTDLVASFGDMLRLRPPAAAADTA